MPKKPFSIFDAAISPRGLAEAILKETQKVVNQPSLEVQALIDKHGKNAVTGMVLKAQLGGAGASHFDVTYDGGKKLPDTK